jgi:hypothetical protein
MMRTPTGFGVGEVLFSSEFRIAPQGVASWELAQLVLDDRDDGPSLRPGLELPAMVGSPVPDGLILTQALEAIERSSGLGGCQLTLTSSGKLRTLATAGVGERLTTVATVRFRSVREDRVFLTLAVEIRGADRKLAEVEVGVEVSPVLIPAPRIAPSFAHAA